MPLQLERWYQAPLPLLLVTHVASGQVVGTTSPPAAGFFEAVGSAATPGGPGSQANLHSLPVQPPLCAPVHLSLDVWMCGILQHPGVLGRATSVELWMLY